MNMSTYNAAELRTREDTDRASAPHVERKILFRQTSNASALGIYGEQTFKSILHRERALAYRHERSFSLIELSMNNGNRNKRCMDGLARVLSSRVRSTDVVGLCGNFKMAAILPETSYDGATQVAMDVCAQLEGFCSAPAFAVHLCPTDGVEKNAIESESTISEAGTETTSDDANNHFSRVDSLLFTGAPLWKRILDIVITVPIVIAVSPVMLMVVLFIKCVSPGPTLFKQERIGYLGKVFTLYKFRTMHVETETDTHQAHLAHLIESDAPMEKLDTASDPRLIPFARWIRAAALDELPQFFNVLLGNMSLVGPRPPIKYEFDSYERWHRRRCDTLPGLTGVWQVTGKNKVSFSTMVRQDIAYAQRTSPWTDIKTIVLTVPAILSQLKETFMRTRRATS
jgi:lipopolysaccharide/colanic/teichoic acid biosynthesis glycosyltransferase